MADEYKEKTAKRIDTIAEDHEEAQQIQTSTQNWNESQTFERDTLQEDEDRLERMLRDDRIAIMKNLGTFTQLENFIQVASGKFSGNDLTNHETIPFPRAFLGQPEVWKFLSNVKYFKADFEIQIVIQAPTIFQGMYVMSAFPLPDRTTHSELAVTGMHDLTPYQNAAAQFNIPHVSGFLQGTETKTIHVPFKWPGPYMNLQVFSTNYAGTGSDYWSSADYNLFMISLWEIVGGKSTFNPTSTASYSIFARMVNPVLAGYTGNTNGDFEVINVFERSVVNPSRPARVKAGEPNASLSGDLGLFNGFHHTNIMTPDQIRKAQEMMERVGTAVDRVKAAPSVLDAVKEAGKQIVAPPQTSIKAKPSNPRQPLSPPETQTKAETESSAHDASTQVMYGLPTVTNLDRTMASKTFGPYGRSLVPPLGSFMEEDYGAISSIASRWSILDIQTFNSGDVLQADLDPYLTKFQPYIKTNLGAVVQCFRAYSYNIELKYVLVAAPTTAGRFKVTFFPRGYYNEAVSSTNNSNVVLKQVYDVDGSNFYDPIALPFVSDHSVMDDRVTQWHYRISWILEPTSANQNPADIECKLVTFVRGTNFGGSFPYTRELGRAAFVHRANPSPTPPSVKAGEPNSAIVETHTIDSTNLILEPLNLAVQGECVDSIYDLMRRPCYLLEAPQSNGTVRFNSLATPSANRRYNMPFLTHFTQMYRAFRGSTEIFIQPDFGDTTGDVKILTFANLDPSISARQEFVSQITNPDTYSYEDMGSGMAWYPLTSGIETYHGYQVPFKQLLPFGVFKPHNTPAGWNSRSFFPLDVQYSVTPKPPSLLVSSGLDYRLGFYVGPPMTFSDDDDTSRPARNVNK